jgi:N-acyl-L-homoserine lactone synthetase
LRCDRTLEPRLKRKAVAELICGCRELGVENGVQRYVGVMPPWIFKHVIGAAGCPVTFLGPVSRVDGRDIVAAHIEVSSEILAAVRAGAGIADPTLVPRLPPIVQTVSPFSRQLQQCKYREP